MRVGTRLGWGVSIAAVALLAAEPLSQGERDFAMSSLHATRKLFLDSVVGLSEAQWSFKPTPDRWSIAECAEHIALSEDLLSNMAKGTLKTPEDPAKAVRGDQARTADQKVLDRVADRSHKVQAPESLQPKHKFASPQEAVEHFRRARDANIDYMEKTQDDLRAHFATHPAGVFDGYQWFLLLSAHSERHTKQINEVKADPKFPKS